MYSFLITQYREAAGQRLYGVRAQSMTVNVQPQAPTAPPPALSLTAVVYSTRHVGS